MNPLLTVKELAQMLNLSERTIHKFIHEDYIPHIKLGHSVRFRQRDIEVWLAKRTHVGRRQRRVEV